MAKLIIYRGDTLDREIELGERNARIGRGDQNEIVLPDPAKSVSRFHAELRFEQGRFTIVDLNSQNGTWVSGRRVQQAVLEPGVPILLGTYRIVLKKEEASLPPEASDATLIAIPAEAARQTAPPPVTSTSATMVGSAVPPAAPPAAPALPKVEPAPAPPPAPKSEPAPAPAPKVEPPPPKPAPPPAPPAPKPAPPPPPKPAPKPEPPPPPKPEPPAPAKPAPSKVVKKEKKPLPVGVLVGAVAVLLIAAAGAAVFLTPLKNRIPGLSSGQQAAAPQAAAAPSGPPPASETAKPAEAPVQAPPAETPRQAAPPPTAARPGAPAAAPAQVPRPPADAAPTAAPRPASATPPRATAPAAAGGRRGREAAPPPAKPLNLAQTLEEARSAMIKGDYLAAIAGFEAILKVDPKYPSAADLLGVAKNGAKNAAQLAIDTGNKAEMSGDYATASKQYDRAQQLDPESTAAPDAIRRMKARMQSEGEDAFKRARQYDAMGRGKDAIPLYERALQLLPSDHASAGVAKERLAALKGGL